MAIRGGGGRNGGGAGRAAALVTRFRFLFVLVTATAACFTMLLINSSPAPPLLAEPTSDLWVERRRHPSPPPQHYTIYTDGCSIPGLQAFEPEITKLITKPVIKPCDTEPPVLKSNETHIWVNKFLIPSPKFSCCYRAFYRPSSISNIYDVLVDNRVKYEKCKVFSDIIKVKDEFVRVTCKLHYEIVHDEFFLFAVFKPMPDYDVDYPELETTTMVANRTAPYNVLILGIDGVSRLNFHRTMPKTNAYMMKRGAIEFLGYNKVGDNTFPNVVPLLLGIKDSELKGTCWRGWRSSFDNCPFVWDAFREAGFYTALGEDSSTLGTFNYQKIGFYTNPTHYYLHTFMNEAEKNVGNNKDFNAILCMGQKPFYKVLMDFVEQLTRVLSNKKMFGFFWEITMTHDYVNYPMSIDAYYEKVLVKLYDSGYLNKTVIVLMSDHGIRWGKVRLTKQGRIEERLPLLQILLPPSFSENHTLAYEHLRKNSRRLVTPFDVHATLSDLADFKTLTDNEIQIRSSKSYADSRSISLFLPLPSNRTCKMAEIDDHWCTCHVGTKLDPGGIAARGVAEFVISHLNGLLSRHRQCAPLMVSEVVEASELVAGAPDKHELGWQEYLVVARATPGGALFEATVRRHAQPPAFALAGTVSRLNLYGNQSHCIHDYTLKIYCYCI